MLIALLHHLCFWSVVVVEIVMPHVVFVPLSGMRIREEELLALGMSLPGLQPRAREIGQLPALAQIIHHRDTEKTNRSKQLRQNPDAYILRIVYFTYYLLLCAFVALW